MGNNSWHDEIDFHCTFGAWPFRKSLDITPAGFLYCGELFPLKTITRLRWGADKKRGGILPRVLYHATFGTSTREFTIKTKQKDFYDHLTRRFWLAAGRRLMAEMLDGLKKGGDYAFGDFTVTDRGITVRPRGIFRSQNPQFFEWPALKWGIVNGSLVFTKAEKPEQPVASASFLWIDNAHILGVALALLQERADKRRLSAIAD